MDKLEILSHLREEYNLSFDFYWKLRESLHYGYEMDMSEKRNFVKELPPKLQVSLARIIESKPLKGIEFFKHKSPHFIAAIAPKLKPDKVSKGDYLFKKGDPLDGIYFIKSGEADYFEPKPGFIFASSKGSSYLGDIEYADMNPQREPKRLFTVKAKTDMDLLILEKEDIYSLYNQFREEASSLFSNSFNRLEKLNKLKK